MELIMKKFFKVVVFIIGGIALLLAAVFLMTAGMPDVAEDFFDSVNSKDQNRIESYLHEYIKNDSVVIGKYLEDNGMSQIIDSSWSSRAFVNNNGTIIGEVTTASNQIIKTRITFIKAEGDWKIYSIQKQDSNEITGVQAPSITNQKAIAHDAMKTFMLSGKEKSMKRFHNYISKFWRSQITIEQLDEAFGSIYKVKSDLSFLDNITPELENYSITKDGILILTGYFKTDNVTIYFNQKHIYEGTQWKLFGFNYSNKKLNK